MWLSLISTKLRKLCARFPGMPAVGCPHRKLLRDQQSLMNKNCSKPSFSQTRREHLWQLKGMIRVASLSFSLCLQQSEVHLVCGEGLCPRRGSHAGADPREHALPAADAPLSIPNPKPLLSPSSSPWNPQTNVCSIQSQGSLATPRGQTHPFGCYPLSDKAWLFSMSLSNIKPFKILWKYNLWSCARGNSINIKNRACQSFMTFPSSHFQPFFFQKKGRFL